MEVRIPDPNPGRCLSYRHHWQHGSVRCLDYEGHDGACQFPQPPPETRLSDVSYTQTLMKPEPWVSPLVQTIGE